jgi:hypothetical protein
MTAFESRPVRHSPAAPSRQRLPSDGMRPLRMNSMSTLALVRDLVKKVLHARKDKKTRMYPDEDDDDPD